MKNNHNKTYNEKQIGELYIHGKKKAILNTMFHYKKRDIRPKKKLLYWRNPTDPKIRPDPTFKKRDTKNDRPILKKAKAVFFF